MADCFLADSRVAGGGGWGGVVVGAGGGGVEIGAGGSARGVRAVLRRRVCGGISIFRVSTGAVRGSGRQSCSGSRAGFGQAKAGGL